MNTTTRPLSIAHLVFGLIFGGIATLWFLGNASDTDFGNQAAGLPVVLIGAGVIGLVAAVLSRRRSMDQNPAWPLSEPVPEPATTTEDTLVLDDTKDPS